MNNPDLTTDRGPDFTPENEAADERRMFGGAREPMRALRDLINMGDHGDEDDILSRARDGFTALRKLFGDNRPADQIADTEAMIEPDINSLRETLALTGGALQCVAQLLPAGERHIVKFTGDWQQIGPQSIKSILDRANAALEPKAEG